MTYGAHQEQAAQALNDLVLSNDPCQGENVEPVLECRRHVVAAARERLTLLAGPWSPPRARGPTVHTVASWPLQELRAVLDGLPQTAAGEIAPSDLLPGPPADVARTVSDRWRCAARNMTLANHELSAAARRPWVSSNATLWHLAGDLAAIVEAVVILDQRLADVDLLPRFSATAHTSQRLVTGDIARLARWFGDDRAADLSYASPLSQLGLYDGPRIHMVHRPEDLATAQRTLAALLRYRNGDSRPRAGLLAARAVSVAQIRLADAFAGWAEQSEGGHTLAGEFQRRIPAYKALHRSTLRLVEVHPVRSPLILAQQSEMLTQLRRFASPALPSDVLVDLNEATHDVSVSLGRTLRREGMHQKNLLVLQEHGLELPRPRPITNTREPFHVACKGLADDPRPACAPDERSTGAQRERLRATLDRQPPASPPPLRSVPDLADRRRPAPQRARALGR
jgi:hypothetical protein